MSRRTSVAFILFVATLSAPAVGQHSEDDGRIERLVAEANQLVSSDSKRTSELDEERTSELDEEIEQLVERLLEHEAGCEDSTERSRLRREIVVGLGRLVLSGDRSGTWRAREDLLLRASSWGIELDRYNDAAILGYFASHALLVSGDPRPAAAALDPIIEDARFTRFPYKGLVWEKRACAARLLGKTSIALEILATAYESSMDDGQRFNLFAEEFRVVLGLGLTDRASRVVEEMERLATGLTSDYYHRALVWNQIQLKYARARYDQVLRDTESYLDSFEDTKVNQVTRARLKFYHALAHAASAVLQESGYDAAAAELSALLESDDLESVKTEEVHALQRQAALAICMGEFDTAEAALRRGDETSADPEAMTLQHVNQAALWFRTHRLRPSRPDALEAGARDLLDRFELFLDSWKQAPVDGAGVGFLHYPYRREVVSECLEAALVLHDSPAAAFDLLVRTQAQGTLARAHGVASAPLSAVRARVVPEHGGLLAYLPGPLGSHLFVVGRSDVRHVRIARESSLVEASQRARVQLLTPPARDRRRSVSVDRAPFDDLGRLLFPPEVVAVMDRWTTLRVCGTDVISSVPIEMATFPSSSAGELAPEVGVRFAVSRLPSVPVGVWLADRPARPRPAGSPRLASVIASVWDAGQELDALPVTASDQDTWAAGLGEEAARLIGDHVTHESLAQLGRDLPCLAILAHGGRDERRSAGLMLSDGLLTAEDVEQIYQGSGAPRHVILGTCEANRGPQRRGDDGAHQLSGAFLAHGSKSVVLADTPLDYHATLRMGGMMLRDHVVEGVDPAEALRRARAALKSDPRFAHPFFYGGLYLVGLGDR